jgi:glutamyl-tRNA reductase
LFTCNRIEIYGEADSEVLLLNVVKSFEAKFSVFQNSYLRLSEPAFLHALSLASGLDSQIIGEKEVIKQLKFWIEDKDFPHDLKVIWEDILSLARKIRVESGLDKVGQNIAQIVLRDIARIGSGLETCKIAIIGTGKVAEIFAQENSPRFKFYFFSKKNYKRANQLAGNCGGKAFLLEDLDYALNSIEVLISATKASHYILKREKLEEMLKKRKQPFHIYDLSIPRSIEPSTEDAKGVILKNLENLKHLFAKHNQELIFYRKKAEQLANELLEFNSGENDGLSDKGRDTFKPACFGSSR